MSGLDDLDDELLELAGGAQSGDDEEQTKEQDDLGNSRRNSPSPAPGASTSKSASKPSPRHDTSRNSRPRSVTPRRRKDESEEEGEASSVASSPRSLGSDAMDESASDSGAASDTSSNRNVLFPLEGKYRNHKDKSQLMALPDLKREEILAERAHQVAEKKRVAELRQLIAAKDREAAKGKKRKAATDFYEDDSPRKSSRPKTKKDEALENLVRRRDANRKEDSRRAAGASRRQSGHRRSASSRSAQSSQRDADGESEYETLSSKPPKDPMGELAEYQRVRIGRSNFADYCFYPTFEATVAGCFTRISYRVDEETGENVYRMAQIKGFTTGKPYQLVDTRGKSFMTNQYLIAVYGKAERDYPFIACSDSKFTDSEFKRWQEALDMDSAQPCKSSYLRTRVVAINALIAYRMTGPQIQDKLEKQDRFIHLLKVKPTNVEHHRREEALHRRNLENRRLNEEQVRSVQLAERKRKKEAARTAQLKRDEAVRMAANGGVDPDKDGIVPLAEKKIISQYIPRDYNSGLKDFTKIKNDDEMIAEMDFDIDVEI